MSASDNLVHSRSLSMGSLPLFVERRAAPGRLRARIEASAAGVQELNLLREQQRQLFEDAKDLLRPRASSLTGPITRQEPTKYHPVREVEMKPEFPSPSYGNSRSHRRYSLVGNVPPPCEYLGRQRAYSFSIYNPSDGSDDTASYESPRNLSLVSPTPPTSFNEENFDTLSTSSSTNGNHYPFPDSPVCQGRSRNISAPSVSSSRRSSLDSVNEDTIEESQEVRNETKVRSRSLPLFDHMDYKLSLPNGNGSIDEANNSHDPWPQAQSSIGNGRFKKRHSLPNSYSPLWRNVVGGGNGITAVHPLSGRVSRSPSVVSDLSTTSSHWSTTSEESYLRPRTLSGTSLTYHFPSPMHAVLMQYERTMVDPGVSSDDGLESSCSEQEDSKPPSEEKDNVQLTSSDKSDGCSANEGVRNNRKTCTKQYIVEQPKVHTNGSSEPKSSRPEQTKCVELDITHSKNNGYDSNPYGLRNMQTSRSVDSIKFSNNNSHSTIPRRFGVSQPVSPVLKDMPLIPARSRIMSLLRNENINIAAESDSPVAQFLSYSGGSNATSPSASKMAKLVPEVRHIYQTEDKSHNCHKREIYSPVLHDLTNTREEGYFSDPESPLERRRQNMSIQSNDSVLSTGSASMLSDENGVSQPKTDLNNNNQCNMLNTLNSSNNCDMKHHKHSILTNQDFYPTKYTLQWGRSDFVETVL